MGFSLQRVDLLTAKKGLSDLAVQLLQDGASRWWIAKMTSSPQGTFWLCLSENWDKMGQMLLLHHFPACDLRVALCSNLLHLKRALFLPNRRREIYGIPLQQSDKSSSGGFSNGLFFSGPVRCEWSIMDENGLMITRCNKHHYIYTYNHQLCYSKNITINNHQ